MILLVKYAKKHSSPLLSDSQPESSTQLRKSNQTVEYPITIEVTRRKAVFTVTYMFLTAAVTAIGTRKPETCKETFPKTCRHYDNQTK